MKFLGREIEKVVLLKFKNSPSNLHEYVQLFENLGLNVSEIDIAGEGELNEDVIYENALYVFTGGPDIHPKYWHSEVLYPELVKLNEERDELEFRILGKLVNVKVSILGICRGMQLINVFFGGSLWQDITEELSHVIVLEVAHLNVASLSPQARRRLSHRIFLARDINRELVEDLAKLRGVHGEYVTSRHHQTVKKVGKGLKPVAYSSDGLIEAIVHESLPILGVQWHPESPLPEKVSMLLKRRKRYKLEEETSEF